MRVISDLTITTC